MKKRMLKVVTLIAIAGMNSVSFSQENQEAIKSKNHAVGVSYNFTDFYNESINFNYRYYLKKINLKAAINLVVPNNYDRKDSELLDFEKKHNQPEVISNIDTTGKFHGIDRNYYQRESFVKFKFGVEKVLLPEANINILIGADVYIGTYKRTGKSNANYYQLDSIENNSFSYWDNPYDKFGVYISEENVKTTEQKNILLGAKLNGGLIFNVSKRLFATTVVNLDLITSVSRKIENSYKNTSYQTELDWSATTVKGFNNNIGVVIGLNYRF